MKTQTYKVDPLYPDEKVIEKSARVIKEGGLVAFPTETVYGLGANALDSQAVEGIFKAKGRPQDNPLIVHVSKIEDVYPLVKQISPQAKRLMEMFWPGPLALLFPKSDLVPATVTAGLSTVAIRMPDNEIARKLIDASGLPLAAPSANRSGRPSPTLASDVLQDLGGKVDIILDGGPTQIGVESTVLDVSGDRPVILRPGGITQEQIEAALNVSAENYSNEKGSNEGSEEGIPQSPGTKYGHYAPAIPMYLALGSGVEQLRAIVFHALKFAFSGKRVAILSSFKNIQCYQKIKEFFNLQGLYLIALGSNDDLAPVASRLYSSLRESENFGANVILSETFNREGLGLAISNRLEKASSGKVLSLEMTEESEADSCDSPDNFISSKPLKIIMVCTGNTCRSPMAEALFKALWESLGGPFPIKASSKGIAAVIGQSAAEQAISAMADRGVDIKSHSPGQISKADMEKAHIIITMTGSHKHMLLSAYPQFGDKIFTLSQLAPETLQGDVLDPFGQNQGVYDHTAGILERAIRVLIETLAGPCPKSP